MMTVFADTFYFLALTNKRDRAHQLAIDWTSGFKGNLVTTEWVLLEFGNHLADPRNRAEFVAIVRDLRMSPQVAIVPSSSVLFDEGLQLYTARMDKAWSITDCISFVVMQQKSITDALTGDHHFEQAGFKAALK